MRFTSAYRRAVPWQRDSATLRREGYPVVSLAAEPAGVCISVRLDEMTLPSTILDKKQTGGT